MAGRKLTPARFNPRSVCDALDGGQVAEGGMSAATNLIFDPATPFTMQCRPAAVSPYAFADIAGAGFVSVAYTVGTVVYGMIKSSAVAGYDSPFAYNLLTGTFLATGGTQNANTLPLTQSPAGDWTPPTMALVGVNLIVTHPGFTGSTSAPASTSILGFTPYSSFGVSGYLHVTSTAGFPASGNVIITGRTDALEGAHRYTVVSPTSLYIVVPVAGVTGSFPGGTASAASSGVTITYAADNGSGLIRLTMASTASFTTGNTALVSGVLGTTEANGTWVVTVINGTTLDLQGTTFINPWVAGGTQLIVEESGSFGWFDLTVPTSPVWNAGNTTGNGLVAVPLAVAQYNSRAYFAVGNAVVFTDPLALSVANASDALLVGDSLPITALAPQPTTTSVQGIIQSLTVFKANVTATISGDSADQNLALSIISSAIGTKAGRSVCPATDGTLFVTSDGVRLLKQDGTFSETNADLKVPFINAVFPSRISGCYNNGIYRVSVQNGSVAGNPMQEYWLDVRRNGWTGPHSFVQDMACPYGGSFVAFNSTLAPSLWVSDTVQSVASVFTENSVPMTYKLGTSFLPDNGGLYENSATLTTADLGLPASSGAVTFTAKDVTHGTLDTAVVPVGTPGVLERYNVPWSTPLVFSRLEIDVTGASSAGVKVGKMTVGYQPLKYVRVP